MSELEQTALREWLAVTIYTRMGDGLEKVASIPASIIYEWVTKYGVNLYNPDHQDDSHGGPLSCCQAQGRLAYFASPVEAHSAILLLPIATSTRAAPAV